MIQLFKNFLFDETAAIRFFRGAAVGVGLLLTTPSGAALAASYGIDPATAQQIGAVLAGASVTLGAGKKK